MANSTDVDIVHSDMCICCKRSKTPGTFFALNVLKGYWIFDEWAAKVEVFRLAAEQGCHRCRFVFEAVAAHGNGTVQSDCEEILVYNRCSEMQADILIRLELQGGEILLLELLAPMRKCPSLQQSVRIIVLTSLTRKHSCISKLPLENHNKAFALP